MKKVMMSLALVLGAGVVVPAMAAPIVSGEAIDSDACELLGETVRLNLSANVTGAYSCNTSTSTIRVATCHAAGSRTPTMVSCVNSAAPGEPADWNLPCCTAEGQQIDTGPNFRGFRGSSQGGQIGIVPLGGVCGAGTVEALVN